MSDMSGDIGKLAEALAAVQAELEPVAKTSKAKIGDKFTYTYADLACVLAAALPALSRHGLAVTQTTEPHEAGVTVTTTLLHTSGQWIRGRLAMRCAADPKAVGSAITYARRYAVSAIIGLASEEDDDGAAAERPAPARTQARSPGKAPPRRPTTRHIAPHGEAAPPPAWKSIKPETVIDASPAFGFVGAAHRGRTIAEAREAILAAGREALLHEVTRDEAKAGPDVLKEQLAVYHCAKRLAAPALSAGAA